MGGTILTPAGSQITLDMSTDAMGVRDAAAVVTVGTTIAAMSYLKGLLQSVRAVAGAYVPGLGYRVTKTENMNTATGVDLFTVTGKVLLTLWAGEVTNALGAAVTDYKLRVKTANVDLCAESDLHGAAIGFLWQMNGDAGDTLLNTVSATLTADTNGQGLAHRLVGLSAGSAILQSLRTAGDVGDEMVHTLYYLPITAAGAVVAA